MTTRAEWKRAHHFAEIAEAVKTDTADVLVAWAEIDHGEPTGALGVLYGRDVIRQAILRRDHYGILRVESVTYTDLRPEDLFR